MDCLVRQGKRHGGMRKVLKSCNVDDDVDKLGKIIQRKQCRMAWSKYMYDFSFCKPACLPLGLKVAQTTFLYQDVYHHMTEEPKIKESKHS